MFGCPKHFSSVTHHHHDHNMKAKETKIVQVNDCPHVDIPFVVLNMDSYPTTKLALRLMGAAFY